MNTWEFFAAVLASSGLWTVINTLLQTHIQRKSKLMQTVEEIKEKMERDSAEREKDKAIEARTRIIRFDDELYNGMKHSREYFKQILSDIDSYEKYCAENPSFKNSEAVEAIANVRKTYEECRENHKFI